MALPTRDQNTPPHTGGPPAFEDLVRTHQGQVFNVCLRMLGNWHEAEDMAQETFVKAHRALPQMRGEARISTWLYRIAVNQCLNRQRSRRRERWLSLDWLFDDGQEGRSAGVPAEETTPATALAKQETVGLVQEAIQALPEKQRVALILHVYERLSYQEIAGVMDCSLSSVEARLHRGKENLARALCARLK